jgi:hypothetical protein
VRHWPPVVVLRVLACWDGDARPAASHHLLLARQMTTGDRCAAIAAVASAAAAGLVQPA